MAVKEYRDGRLKLTGKDYTDAKKAQWEKQGKRCRICALYVPWEQAELDHIKPRGMGGGNRDDRPDNIRIVHHYCHFERHWRERDGAAKISA